MASRTPTSRAVRRLRTAQKWCKSPQRASVAERCHTPLVCHAISPLCSPLRRQVRTRSSTGACSARTRPSATAPAAAWGWTGAAALLHVFCDCKPVPCFAVNLGPLAPLGGDPAVMTKTLILTEARALAARPRWGIINRLQFSEPSTIRGRTYPSASPRPHNSSNAHSAPQNQLTVSAPCPYPLGTSPPWRFRSASSRTLCPCCTRAAPPPARRAGCAT